MEIQGDIGLYLSGEPIKVPTCGIYIVPPKIKDIALYGENDFFMAVQILSDIKNIVNPIRGGNNELAEVPDFQIFIGVLCDSNSNPVKKNISSFFSLCCPNLIVEYDKHSINFKAEEDGPVVGIINTFTYGDFATIVKELFTPQQQDDEDPEYHIDENDPYARRLLEKIMKNRERLAKAKAQKEGDKSTSLFGTYISILAVGLQMDIRILYNYTPFQIYDSFRRYMAKNQWDRYERMLTVPFADTSSLQDNAPDNWITDLYGPKKEHYNSLQDMNQLNKGLR